MAHARTGRPPSARDWAGTAAVCAGVALLAYSPTLRAVSTPLAPAARQ
ncbi:hypothetical protein [Catellatospora sp. IY07-71]|nr:hypothetical protein [Catellatospora sp. IY07-71]